MTITVIVKACEKYKQGGSVISPPPPIQHIYWSILLQAYKTHKHIHDAVFTLIFFTYFPESQN